MLSWLEIKNFEKWKSLRFKIGNITLIKGRSDSGKSSIIRALKKVLYNDKGVELHHGSNSASVLLIKDNRKIKWVRHTDGSLLWYLDDEQYKHGSVIPEDIKKVLNIRDDLGLRINLSEQFNSLFLIEMSGSKLSDVLNSLFRLDKSNRFLSELDKRIRGLKEKIKMYKEELSNLVEPDVMRMKKIQDLIDTYNDYEKVKGLVDKLYKLNNDYKLLKVIKGLDLSIIDKYDKIKKLNGLYKKIDLFKNLDLSIIDKYNKLFRLQKLYNSVGVMKGIDFKVVDIYNGLVDLLKVYGDRKKIVDDLKEIKENIVTILDGDGICPLTGKPFYAGCLKVLKK